MKKIIPNSIVKLLGISCCSWIAWTSIDAQAVEKNKKINSDATIVNTFESINKSKDKGPFVVSFDDHSSRGDIVVDKSDALIESKIIIQKPLTFDSGNKKIALKHPLEADQEIVKIEMPKRADVCTFTNIDAIQGGVNLVKGVFSIPVGVIKGTIRNNSQLVLRATNGQSIKEHIEGPGAITIQADGVVKLETASIGGEVILKGEENKTASLIVSTDTAPHNYLASTSEGDWIIFNQDFSGIYAGSLLGKGGLAKMGTGSLTLTGNNEDRNSLTRIFSGEILIEKPENLGAYAPVSFRGGALHFTGSLQLKNPLLGKVHLIIDEEKTVEVLGSIGNGLIKGTSLEVEGIGTVSIKGSNVYEGDTVISNATLHLESDDSLGKGENLVLKHAILKTKPEENHLDLERNIIIEKQATIHTDAKTVNLLKNVVSANNELVRLIKRGSGKLAIHGNIANSKLLIKKGIVHIASADGIEQGHILDSLKSPIEILGKINELKEQRGSPTSPMLFLHAVEVDDNADLSISRDLVHIDKLHGYKNGLLSLDNRLTHLIIEEGDFKGLIFSPEATIIKTGKEELKLSGDNSHLFGNMIIGEGKLVANSNISSKVFVLEGGHLSGNAHVAALLNQGNISPGNSIGTILVDGDFVQGSNGRINIEVNPQGESDLIQVAGNATLDGTLRIIPEPGIYRAGTEYKILEATKVAGSFQNVENTASDTLAFDVKCEANEVVASINKTMYQLPKIEEMSENSKNVTDLMQEAQFREGSDAFSLIENLFSLDNKEEIEDAYSQIAPIQLGSILHDSYINAGVLADSYTSALRRNDRCSNSVSNIWVNPIGRYANQKHRNKIGNYKSSMGGIVIGANHFVSEDIVIGAGIGCTSSCLNWGPKKRAISHITSFYAGLTGGWIGDVFYANAALITSGSTFSNQRHLRFENTQYTTHSEHYGIGVISRIEAGCNFAVTKNICLRPFMDLDVYTVFERPVNESNSSPMHFHRHSKVSQELRTKIAVEATGTFVYDSLCFSPGLLLGWTTQTPLRDTDYKVFLNDTGKQLVIRGFEKDQIYHGVALGANLVAGYKTTSVFLSYEFDLGKSHSYIHQASIGIDWKF